MLLEGIKNTTTAAATATNVNDVLGITGLKQQDLRGIPAPLYQNPERGVRMKTTCSHITLNVLEAFPSSGARGLIIKLARVQDVKCILQTVIIIQARPSMNGLGRTVNKNVAQEFLYDKNAQTCLVWLVSFLLLSYVDYEHLKC